MSQANNLQLIDNIISDLSQHRISLQKNAFDELFIQNISQSFDQQFQQGHFKPAQIGRLNTQSLNTQIRSDLICWIDQLPEFENQFINPFVSALNQQLFVGINEYEFHFAQYQNGAQYELHRDQHSNKQGQTTERVFTLILYLNKNWQESDGGQLEVSDYGVVQPMWNHLVVFDSAQFPHRVLASNFVRRSLTGWLKRRTV